MFCFKNKFNILIIVMSFKIQGACPLQVASVEALRVAESKFVHATDDMRYAIYLIISNKKSQMNFAFRIEILMKLDS